MIYTDVMILNPLQALKEIENHLYTFGVMMVVLVLWACPLTSARGRAIRLYSQVYHRVSLLV